MRQDEDAGRREDAREGAREVRRRRGSFVIINCGAPLPLFGGAFDRVLCTLLTDHLSPIGERAVFYENIGVFCI